MLRAGPKYTDLKKYRMRAHLVPHRRLPVYVGRGGYMQADNWRNLSLEPYSDYCIRKYAQYFARRNGS